MEWWIVVLLIIAVASIVAAIILLLRHWNTAIYERRLNAEANFRVALMRAVLPPPGYTVYGVVIKTGEVLMRRVVTPNDSEQDDSLTSDEIEAHDLAIRLINDSISALGKDAQKLLPANKWSSAEMWSRAVRYLVARGLVMTSRGGTALNKSHSLIGLMTDLAVYNASPPTPPKVA